MLLGHIEHHMSGGGLGFRQIIDWMCYVNAVLTDELWSSRFREMAEQAGLVKLAVHVTRLCEIYFGLPGHEFSKAADESICKALFEDIYSSGNFGCSTDRMEGKISAFRNYGNVFARLQMGGMYNWKAAQKYPILRPFAWLYQAFRLLFIMLRPSSLKKLGAGNRLAESRDRLYKSLGINSYRGK